MTPFSGKEVKNIPGNQAQQTVQKSPDERLKQALSIIEDEHGKLRTMKAAEIEIAQLRTLRSSIVKPYQDAARIVSKDLRVQAKGLATEIQQAEAPTLTKMAKDTVSWGGSTMTAAARVESIDAQAKAARARFGAAKAALYEASGPVEGQ
jgi:hypothetical protein